MADWGFRFTPESEKRLAELVDELEKVLQAPPNDRDDESARWETKSSYFDTAIAPVLMRLQFSGEILSDGEASGGGVQEWTFERGERTEIFEVEG